MFSHGPAKASSKAGSRAWRMRPRFSLSPPPQHPYIDRVLQIPPARFLWAIRELILLVAAYFLYMFTRKVILGDVAPIATDNAHKVIDLEEKLHFFWEPGWQSWVIENAGWLVVTMNWSYILTFFPIIIVTAIIVYLRDRPRYTFYRNVILTSFVVSLLVFIFFPLTPPRMLGAEFGIIDAIAEYGPAIYGGREMAFYYNAYAAMPSVHFAWTILFGILFWNTRGPRLVTPWLKLWGVSYPILTFFAITITGNHYILDAIGGALVAIISLLVYNGILLWWGRVRKPATTSTGTTKSRRMPSRGRTAAA